MNEFPSVQCNATFYFIHLGPDLPTPKDPREDKSIATEIFLFQSFYLSTKTSSLIQRRFSNPIKEHCHGGRFTILQLLKERVLLTLHSPLTLPEANALGKWNEACQGIHANHSLVTKRQDKRELKESSDLCGESAPDHGFKQGKLSHRTCS